MEGKKSFLLYADIIHTVRQLPKEKISELFLLILSYVNDENPIINEDDLILKLVFEPIKQSLKRDLEKWKYYTEKQRINGKKGGRPKNPPKPKKPKPFKENPKNPSQPTETQKSHTSVSVSVSDSVNVNDSVSVIFTPTNLKNWLSQAEEWKTKSCVAYKTSLIELENFATEFIQDQTQKQKAWHNTKDAIAHFVSWLKLQKQNGKKIHDPIDFSKIKNPYKK